MNFKITNSFLIYFVILVFASIIHLYFFQPLLIHNFNVFEYLRIIVEFNKNIQNGSFVPRWAPDFANGYGTPFFIFNQSLGYYITEILYLICYDYFVAIKLSFLLVTFFSGLYAYLLSREFSGKFSGLLLSFLYMILPYLSSSLNRSFTFSGFSALPWIPLVIWSFYKMQNCKKEKIKYLLLSSFSYALLIMSHGNISWIFLFALILYILFMSLYCEKKTNRIHISFISLIIAIFLSAFFWMPASYEKKYLKKDENIPVWARKISGNYPEKRFTALTGNVRLIHEKFSANEYFFRVSATEGSSIRINIHYFPGWKVYVWDNTKKNTFKRKEIKINYLNDYGLMDINIPSGAPHIDVIFTNTFFRWIANILSFCGVLALYFIYILSRRDNEGSRS